MIEQTQLNVGMRIRTLREHRGLSLRALAERCGLSINAISLIERGRKLTYGVFTPSPGDGSCVKITDFFEDPNEHAVVYVKRNQRLRSSGERGCHGKSRNRTA